MDVIRRVSPEGSFGTAGTNTVAVVTTDSPKAGLQHLRLQLYAPSQSQSQWAMLKLDLSAQAGATNLYLDFWAMRQINDSPSYSDLNLEVSGDGQTWTNVLNTDAPTSYQNYVIDLDAVLAAGGIALDTNVFIRFRQSAIYYTSSIFLDEVRVTRGSPSRILSWHLRSAASKVLCWRTPSLVAWLLKRVFGLSVSRFSVFLATWVIRPARRC